MTGWQRLERFSWIVGVSLLAAWAGLRGLSTWASARAVEEFEQRLAPSDMSQWSDSRRHHYEESLGQASAPAIGVLTIPKVGLKAPLFEGTGDLALDRGVGHIDGTTAPGESGNVGIAGHRDGFFRGLKDLGIGDVIVLKTVGETATYVVAETRVVAPEDVSVLASTPVPSLTLVTCFPFYHVGPAPQRYIVRAVRR
ncbi:MAG TPA: class D sortase [Candidatus Polarisedimenticolaceae bacterium]|nr:class D sortase [Candidatus Polarisedimenticolaceae bacterium]